jgi:2-oxoglutarate ferredoxin oxidoreductase subunit delta
MECVRGEAIGFPAYRQAGKALESGSFRLSPFQESGIFILRHSLSREGKGAGVNVGLRMADKKKKKEMPKIDIYKAWCKACGICVAFCPTGALAKDEAGNPYVKDIGQCINCGWCEIRCPDFAITVETKPEEKKRIEVKGGEEEPSPKEEEVSPERIAASRE